MKIWAKTITENKIVKSIIYENNLKLNFENYELMLREVAQLLDIPTPLSLKSHFNHLFNLNIHKYSQSDFVESIDFDKLEIEKVAQK